MEGARVDMQLMLFRDRVDTRFFVLWAYRCGFIVEFLVVEVEFLTICQMISDMDTYKQ